MEVRSDVRLTQAEEVSVLEFQSLVLGSIPGQKSFFPISSSSLSACVSRTLLHTPCEHLVSMWRVKYGVDRCIYVSATVTVWHTLRLFRHGNDIELMLGRDLSYVAPH